MLTIEQILNHTENILFNLNYENRKSICVYYDLLKSRFQITQMLDDVFDNRENYEKDEINYFMEKCDCALFDLYREIKKRPESN